MENAKHNQVDRHQGAKGDKGEEGSIVSLTDTVVQPNTMVIFVFYQKVVVIGSSTRMGRGLVRLTHAIVTLATMTCSGRSIDFARPTVFQIPHDILDLDTSIGRERLRPYR